MNSTRIKIRGVAAVISACILIACARGMESKNTGNREIEQGRAYLKKLEERKTGPIEDKIRDNRQKDIADEKDEFTWSRLSDTVLVGDSRTSGFKEYGFLAKDQVLAEVGDHFTKIPDITEELVVKNPAQIVFCYGVNDIGYSAWGTPEKFAEKYYSLVSLVMKALPDTKFYICAIIPAQKQVEEKTPFLKEIPSFNEALKEMCKKKKIGYIDCDSIIEDKYYEKNDGVHFIVEFYPIWGEYIYQKISE